jgi:hypothetical protein
MARKKRAPQTKTVYHRQSRELKTDIADLEQEIKIIESFSSKEEEVEVFLKEKFQEAKAAKNRGQMAIVVRLAANIEKGKTELPSLKETLQQRQEDLDAVEKKLL